MLPIPTVNRLDVAFGKIDHMPNYYDIPDDFKKMSNPYVSAVSDWFFNGAKGLRNGIEINGTKFVARDGVDAMKALAAIRAILGSFEPKHEHKEAGCAYLLHEWFEIKQPKAA